MPHCGGRDEQDTIPVLENLRSGENSSLDAHELGHLIYHSQMAELQFVGGRGTPTSLRLALSLLSLQAKLQSCVHASVACSLTTLQRSVCCP